MPRYSGMGMYTGALGGITPTKVLAPQQMTDQQAYIVQSFQSQVYIQDMMDVQDEPIYDTVSFLTGQTMSVTTVSFFTNVGDSAPMFLTATINKTLANTNMSASGKLIAPEAQAIFQHRLQFNENIDPRDLLSITGANVAAGLGTLPTGFAYVFKMGTKEYQTGFIMDYAGGGGIYFTGTADTQSFLSNGMPCANCAESLSVNTVIENEETFKANFVGNPYIVLGSTGVSIKGQLMGLHARPIR
jgi:hypothetical protein